MIKRVWRIIVAICTFGLVRLETKNAVAIRATLIDEKVGQVAQAERGLGDLAGAVRSQTREVARLEKEFNTLTQRKAHFLVIVKANLKDSPDAASAKTSALSYYHQSVEVADDLNAGRTELTRLANEYEASKALIIQARSDVKDAKRKGVRQDQRLKSARRREQLVRTTSSLRGLGGISDDLANLDEQIETAIDSLEGSTFVTADMASQELGERQLDAQIARVGTDAAFYAELEALEAEGSEETPMLPSRSESIEGLAGEELQAQLEHLDNLDRHFKDLKERQKVPASRPRSEDN